MDRMHPSSGFTLLELLVCLFIISILTISSVSTLQIIKRWQLNSATLSLLTAINSARSLALSRGQYTFLCPGNSLTGCSSTWTDQYLLIADINHNRKPDGDDLTISEIRFSEGISVNWKAFRKKAVLSFTTEGFTESQNGRFQLCSESFGAALTSEIIVNRSGRARLAVPKTTGLVAC